MVVVDRRYSYVGSGELRTASFITNGEAGSIYTGLSAEFWADFFEIFWKRAIDVLRNIQV